MTKWARIRYQPNLPLGKNGQRVTACEEHISLSKNAAKEGMVLLKNEGGILPLVKGVKVALFGKGTFDYVKGGGGSGDVTVEYVVNLYDGIKKLGNYAQIEENLASFYRDYMKEQYEQKKEPGMIAEPELPDMLCQKAREFTDTAVISISRFSGEAWDRGGRGQELFENGDFYLSNAEALMIEKVKKLFPKIIIVLNVGGIVDTQWFYEEEKIQSVLMAWQGGMEGGTAAAELLFGIGNPSGKLSDTFAKKLTDYPSTATFHESDEYVDYIEDIYVGYRYFETIPGAKNCVNYPFGFGLSYTTFSYEIVSGGLDGKEITFSVSVTNTGKTAGKEVIQIYASAPQGNLGKAARHLVAYKKTKELMPGESQTLELRFDVSSMASYDDMGKIVKSAYVLEKGIYSFHIGTSVRHTVQADYVYEVVQDTLIERLSPKIVPNSLKKRMLSDGSYEMLPLGEPKDPNATGLPAQDIFEKCSATPAVRAVPHIPRAKYDNLDIHKFQEVAEGKITLDEFVEQLSDEQVIHLLGGQPITGVANTWGFGNVPEFQVPSAMTADGPAGVRIEPDVGVKTTAFPCATLLSCTWNPDITYAIGQAGAKEIKENNLAAWLTPAINIHRSPLCGRNFEYYSEDPFLTGTMAVGMVKGIQSQHIAPSVKHFALNNKETNRRNSDSRVSERAAREIYLKPFEIVVKGADPWYIMSSYNIINGCRASENRELLEDILRGEWGFSGIVSTDWWTLAEQYKEVKAGNDLKMPSGFPDRMKAAMDAGLIIRAEMEISVKRILNLILKFD